MNSRPTARGAVFLAALVAVPGVLTAGPAQVWAAGPQTAAMAAAAANNLRMAHVTATRDRTQADSELLIRRAPEQISRDTRRARIRRGALLRNRHQPVDHITRIIHKHAFLG